MFPRQKPSDTLGFNDHLPQSLRSLPVPSVFHRKASLPADDDPATALGRRFISIVLGGNERHPPKGPELLHLFMGL